jgi:competence ComEA-like helix-hairpin-helix protein
MFKFTFALFVCFAAVVPAQDLPDAEGKELIVKTCTVCHGLEPILKAGRDADGWQETAEFMEQNGARIDPDEKDSIINYLTTYLGPFVDINSASADALQQQLGLSDKEASTLVKYRESKGGFKKFADLAQIPGVDGKKLALFRYRLRFE